MLWPAVIGLCWGAIVSLRVSNFSHTSCRHDGLMRTFRQHFDLKWFKILCNVFFSCYYHGKVNPMHSIESEVRANGCGMIAGGGLKLKLPLC